jgi:hypothetical protein
LIARTALLLTLVATAALGAEVYRSTDANGTVSYSDRPQNDRAQAVFVATPRAGTPATAPIQRPKPAAGSSSAQTETQPGSNAAAKKQPTPAEQAAEKEKNCATARERQQKYAESHRLYRTSPSGEREYLSANEIDEAKAKAAAEVDTWCK